MTKVIGGGVCKQAWRGVMVWRRLAAACHPRRPGGVGGAKRHPEKSAEKWRGAEEKLSK
jgi:hypothetical protein